MNREEIIAEIKDMSPGERIRTLMSWKERQNNGFSDMDNTVNKLIREIRNIALSGQQDSVFGQEFILWQTVGTFLAVYAEDVELYGQYTYLLYRCSDDAEYNRSIILNPLLETENFRCLFEYKECHDQQELIRFIDAEQWLDEFEELVNDMVSED